MTTPRSKPAKPCKHLLDQKHFPVEHVRDFIVGRCVKCSCIVALTQLRAVAQARKVA